MRSARGASGTWFNASGGSWVDPNNWATGVGPTAYGDDATFSLNANYTVTFAGDAQAGQLLDLRDAVSLALGGHTLTTKGDIDVGEGARSALRVSGGTLNQASGQLLVANHNVGGLAVDSGGQLISAGPLTAANTNGGFNSTPAVEVSQNSQLSTGPVGLATNAGATGVIATVHDAGSSWTVAGDFGIGGYNGTAGGSAGMTIGAGGTLAVSGTVKVYTAGSALTVAGGTLTMGNLDLGGQSNRLQWSAGTLDFATGGLAVGQGADFGSSLSLPVAKTVVAGGGIVVGYTGPGTLDVSGGSATATGNSSLVVGPSGPAGYSGAMNVIAGSVSAG